MATAVAETLQRQGWYLTTDGVSACSPNGSGQADVVVKAALDLDLKDIGERHLQDGTGKVKTEFVDGPFVLQIQKLRNLSAPKENEESQGAPPIFKVTLTDGHSTCAAVEMEKINNFGLDTPPGTKIKLIGRVPINHGFLLLTNSRCKVLGGQVAALVESWKLKKSLAKISRANVAKTGGAPVFVPFGQKPNQQQPSQKQQLPSKQQQQQRPTANNQINSKKPPYSSKSLTTNTDKKEDIEFEQQRRAVIAEALQTKSESKKPKTFTSSKQVEDTDVAKIVEMGFPAEQASAALRQTGGKLDEAINNLLGIVDVRPDGYTRPGGDTRPHGRTNMQHQDRPDRPRRERRNEEDDELTQGRPSAPATLFDFLTTKISTKTDTKTPNTSTMQDTKAPRNGRDAFNSPHDKEQSRQTTQSNPPPRFAKHQQTDDRRRPASNDSFEYRHRPNTDNQQAGHRTDTRGPRSDRVPRQPGENEQRNNQRNQFVHQGGASGRAPSSASPARRTQTEISQPAPQRSCIGGDMNVSAKSYNRTRGPVSIPTDRERLEQQAAVRSLLSGQGDTGQGSGGRDNIEQKMSGLRVSTAITTRQGTNFQPQNVCSQSLYSVPPPTVTSVNYSSSGGPVDGYRQNAGMMMKPPPARQWKNGEYCMAKYWQDGQYYCAIVTNVRAGSGTCDVTFPDYGNTEQVPITELQPLNGPQCNWGASVASALPSSVSSPMMQTQQETSCVPPMYTTAQPFQGQIGGNMVFRTGGGGVPHRVKPQQNLYPPPRQGNY